MFIVNYIILAQYVNSSVLYKSFDNRFSGVKDLKAPYGETVIVTDSNAKTVISEFPSDSSKKLNDPIDFVISWINGSDPHYLELLAQYAPTLDPHRFQEYGSLFFSVLSLLKFAPWLRYIYIVTSHDQVPSFANLFPRVKIIPDTLILPAAAVPTFNSHVIESYIHKIPGLAERFVYLCDDFFLGRPTTYADFFNESHPIIFISERPQFQLSKVYTEVFFQAPVNSFLKLQEFNRFENARPLRNIPHRPSNV